jgi:hypothetical protein
MASDSLLCDAVVHPTTADMTVWTIVYTNSRQVSVRVKRLNVSAANILANRESIVRVGIVHDQVVTLFGDYVVEVPAGWGLLCVDCPMVAQSTAYAIAWNYPGLVIL